MNARLFAACVLTGACTLAAAQGTIYESKDKAGPVFSGEPSYTDQPSAAKPVVVPPMNVYKDTMPSVSQSAPAAAPPAYRSFAISKPAAGGTIHSNTGAFDVRVAPYPALRTSAGDRIKLKLDGNPLASSYKSASIRVTSADWQAAAVDNVQHTVQAAVVDKTGAVLIESASVSFYAHRATVRR